MSADKSIAQCSIMYFKGRNCRGKKLSREETVAGINCREINLATFATVSSAKDRFWPFRDS